MGANTFSLISIFHVQVKLTISLYFVYLLCTFFFPCNYKFSWRSRNFQAIHIFNGASLQYKLRIIFIKRALKLMLYWPVIFGRRLIEMSLTRRGPARTSFSSKRIVSATINYTVPWKIFVVACIGIFGKEYQSAYWIVGARITLWLDSKSGSRDVYCYRNDIEGTTCLHRPSINPLATASNFPAVPSPANCAYAEIQNLF